MCSNDSAECNSETWIGAFQECAEGGLSKGWPSWVRAARVERRIETTVGISNNLNTVKWLHWRWKNSESNRATDIRSSGATTRRRERFWGPNDGPHRRTMARFLQFWRRCWTTAEGSTSSQLENVPVSRGGEGLEKVERKGRKKRKEKQRA